MALPPLRSSLLWLLLLFLVLVLVLPLLRFSLLWLLLCWCCCNCRCCGCCWLLLTRTEAPSHGKRVHRERPTGSTRRQMTMPVLARPRRCLRGARNPTILAWADSRTARQRRPPRTPDSSRGRSCPLPMRRHAHTHRTQCAAVSIQPLGSRVHTGTRRGSTSILLFNRAWIPSASPSQHAPANRARRRNPTTLVWAGTSTIRARRPSTFAATVPRRHDHD